MRTISAPLALSTIVAFTILAAHSRASNVPISLPLGATQSVLEADDPSLFESYIASHRQITHPPSQDPLHEIPDTVSSAHYSRPPAFDVNASAPIPRRRSSKLAFRQRYLSSSSSASRTLRKRRLDELEQHDAAPSLPGGGAEQATAYPDEEGRTAFVKRSNGAMEEFAEGEEEDDGSWEGGEGDSDGDEDLNGDEDETDEIFSDSELEEGPAPSAASGRPKKLVRRVGKTESP